MGGSSLFLSHLGQVNVKVAVVFPVHDVGPAFHAKRRVADKPLFKRYPQRIKLLRAHDANRHLPTITIHAYQLREG
jgi:hypothetical protein